MKNSIVMLLLFLVSVSAFSQDNFRLNIKNDILSKTSYKLDKLNEATQANFIIESPVKPIDAPDQIVRPFDPFNPDLGKWIVVRSLPYEIKQKIDIGKNVLTCLDDRIIKPVRTPSFSDTSNSGIFNNSDSRAGKAAQLMKDLAEKGIDTRLYIGFELAGNGFSIAFRVGFFDGSDWLIINPLTENGENSLNFVALFEYKKDKTDIVNFTNVNKLISQIKVEFVEDSLNWRTRSRQDLEKRVHDSAFYKDGAFVNPSLKIRLELNDDIKIDYKHLQVRDIKKGNFKLIYKNKVRIIIENSEVKINEPETGPGIQRRFTADDWQLRKVLNGQKTDVLKLGTESQQDAIKIKIPVNEKQIVEAEEAREYLINNLIME